MVEDLTDPDRCTGRTTKRAVNFIAAAMSCEGTPIKIQDHHGTVRADRDLVERIRQYIDAMGLKGFVLNSKRDDTFTLVYRFPDISKSKTHDSAVRINVLCFDAKTQQPYSVARNILLSNYQKLQNKFGLPNPIVGKVSIDESMYKLMLQEMQSW